MTKKVSWNENRQALAAYRSQQPIQPVYPVDIVRMSYRQPDVSKSEVSRITDLEDRVKELETLVLELKNENTLLSQTVTEIRNEGCWMLKK
jgi:hypothetical protein